MATAALASALWTEDSQSSRFCFEAEDSKLNKEAVAQAERRETRVSCLSCILVGFVIDNC